MSTNPLELSAVYGVLAEPAENPPPAERRRRARSHVHWAVLLFRDHGGDVVESLTRNLSSNGFYCLSEVAFTPGERLICALKIPSHDPKGKHLEQRLECRVRVLRVEPHNPEGMVGLACQIEDYHFGPVPTQRAQ